MSRRAVCTVCFSSDFTVLDGLTYCAACGTQLAERVEEEQEYQVGVDDNRYRRRAYREKVVRPREAEDDVDESEGACQQQILAYTACLQAALQDGALYVESTLAAEGLSPLCRTIWLSTLAQSGVLEPWAAAACDLKRERARNILASESSESEYEDEEAGAGGAEGEGEGEEGEDVGEAEGEGRQEEAEATPVPEPGPDQRRRKGRGVKRRESLRDEKIGMYLSKRLPVHIVPTIVYLACLSLRLPVLPMDLIAWTRGGSIPAAVLERYLAPLALTHAGAVTLRMARLAKQPSEGLLHAHAVKLAERLGLSLRLPAEETLIPRIVEEAALPRLLCGPALAVLEVLQGPLARLPLERPPPIPGALAAGAVHIALKLLGVLRDRAPGVALRPLKIRGLGGVTAPATELEAPFMGRAAVEEYITAIRNESFYTIGHAPAIEPLIAVLQQHCAVKPTAPAAPAPAKQPAPLAPEPASPPPPGDLPGPPRALPWAYPALLERAYRRQFVECGQADPDLGTLHRLAAALHVRVQPLLTRVQQMERGLEGAEDMGAD